MDLPGPRAFEAPYIYLSYFWVYMVVFSILLSSSARPSLLGSGLVKKEAI